MKPTIKQMTIALIAFAIISSLFLLSVAAQAEDLGFAAGSMFDRLDANHDGVLSKDEVNAARARMFERIDADRDDVITVTEIEAAKAAAQERGARRFARLSELRAKMRTPSERFAAMDRNRDGKITREEFVEQSPWFDRLQKNGVVTKSDFAALLDGKENVQP